MEFFIGMVIRTAAVVAMFKLAWFFVKASYDIDHGGKNGGV